MGWPVSSRPFQGIEVVREVHDDHGSAVLYDADLPAGVVRFAEFFTFEEGLIATLDLHYDGQQYIASAVVEHAEQRQTARGCAPHRTRRTTPRSAFVARLTS